MRALAQRTLALPLATIFFAQSVLTMGAYALPVVIPVAALDLGVQPESVGFFVACAYLSAMLVGLTSGALLTRFGPTRVFQFLLLLVGAGAVVLASGIAGAALAGAVLIGFASGPMNPSGSMVLMRVTPPDLRALVFSLKQCGTPFGGMLAGTLLPWLMVSAGWQQAMLLIPAFALVLIVLAPFGGLGGAAAPPTGSGSREAPCGDRAATSAALLLWRDPALRAVTIAGFGLAVCQMGLASYLVVYLLNEAGYSPALAGGIFALLHASGIASRVALGFVADRLLETRRVLALIGFVLGAAFVLIAVLDSGWSIAVVYLAVIMAGASGNGWVGLYFAELARLSPQGQVAQVAGASQFITYLGIVCGPLLFGALLHATASYATVFFVMAVAATGCGAYLVQARPRAS